MKELRKSEKGQIIPIIAVTFIVVVLMAAVILDGGSLMANRRTAQAAADSAAMAGAKVYCNTKDSSAAITAAQNYAYSNHASQANASVDSTSISKIKVDVVITQGSFFSRLMGQKKLDSTATASAGCFPPSTFDHLLPVAWSCRPPIGGSASPDCEYVPLDWTTQIKPVLDTYSTAAAISTALYTTYNTTTTSYIYIIMDSDATCGSIIDPKKGTTFICDFNGDGKNEIESGGNRGWLNLTGDSSGTPNLTNMVQNGTNNISVHTWYSGISGNKTPGYTAINSYQMDKIVWVPVFNVICDHVPDISSGSTDACITAAHSSTPPGVPLETNEVEKKLTGSPATPIYHVVAFAPFFVTCVHLDKKDNCPGFNKAQSIDTFLGDNTNSVEGYFVKNPPFKPGDTGTGGADLGNYVISLTQ